MSEKFEIKLLSKLEYYLGINISHDFGRNLIIMNQRKYIYIDELLSKFNMNECRHVITPIDPNVKLSKMDDLSEEGIKTKYQQIIGSFHYLVSVTRPDLAVVTCILSQYNQNHSNDHLLAAKCVLRLPERHSKLWLIVQG